jgi:two-component system phosphate regulon response regulator PhoB
MPTSGPILVVDDEEDLRILVQMTLAREGFEVVVAPDGATALAMAERVKPVLVILDMMLPDLSGSEVCRRLKAASDVPVIILSARGEEIDRVVGFEVGADDYVVKANLSTRELVLRVRAMLRRHESASPALSTNPALEVQIGVLRLDHEAHRIWVEGEEVALTATEFRLLATLIERSGRVLSRGLLLQDVWDVPSTLNTRTVDTHVKRLREKLGAAASYVETVRGVGYRFSPPVA